MDSVQQALQKIIAAEGRGIIDDRRRLEGFLRDYCGSQHREIRVLLAALEENVPRELINTSAQAPMPVLIANLTQRLRENGGFSEDVSRWAVESWALALGIIPDRYPRQPGISLRKSQGATRDRMSILLAGDMPLELVRIPPGEFLMGSARRLFQESYENEQPRHKVNLPEYWIGAAPVTVAQFAIFVEASGYTTTAEKAKNEYTWRAPLGEGSDVQAKAGHPVTNVTWHDGRAFCEWLTQRLPAVSQGLSSPTLGKWAARLPSEAEWEKAARGTKGLIYPWGSQAPDDRRCNFDNRVRDTTPVGQYSPRGDSPFGCMDMAGNVWECTSSLWGRENDQPEYHYPYRADDGRETLSAPDTVYRVARGGCFGSGADGVRSAYRSWLNPGDFFRSAGFRVVVAPSL